MWWVTRQGRIPCLVGDALLRMGEGKGQETRSGPVCRAVYAASQLIFNDPPLLGTSKNQDASSLRDNQRCAGWPGSCSRSLNDGKASC